MSNGGAGSILSGFLQGMARGKANKRRDAMLGEELDYKKRVLKNQEDSLKLKQEAAAKKQAGADQFMSMIAKLAGGGVPQAQPQAAPQQAPSQIGGGRFSVPSEIPQQGLTDRLAANQIQTKMRPSSGASIQGMDPVQLAAISSMGKQYGVDVDLLGAGKLAETRAGTSLKERKFGEGQIKVAINPQTMKREYVKIRPGQPPMFTGAEAPDTRATTNINMGGDKTIMDAAVKQMPSNRTEALLAQKAVKRIDNALDLVAKQGDNIVGWSGALRRGLSSAAKFIGLDIESMTDAQLLDNLLATGQGSLRMEVIGPGPVSDYEGQVLKEVAGRKISAAEGIKKILEYQRENQAITIDTWNDDVANISAVKGYELVKNIYKPIKYSKRGESTPKPPAGFTVIQ